MADARAAWNETGDKLTQLGRKLKVHYDSQHGGERQATREELSDAARRLRSAVQDTFEAIGTAARDKAVQDDVKQVGQSLAEALGATLGQAADELKRTLSERKGQAGAHRADQAPPAAGTGPGSTATTTATEPPTAGPTPVATEPPLTEPPLTESPADTAPPTGTASPAATDRGDEQPPKVEPWGTP